MIQVKSETKGREMLIPSVSVPQLISSMRTEVEEITEEEEAVIEVEEVAEEVEVVEEAEVELVCKSH